MDDEHEKEHHTPASVQEAVNLFNKERDERISIRRARIAEKIAAERNANALPEPVFTGSSTDFLFETENKPVVEEKKDEGGKKKKGSFSTKKQLQKKAAAADAEAKRGKVAQDQLDVQLEESRKQLEQMILDGEVLITNVRVAAEYREKIRQHQHEESKKERLARLRQEADESQAMYDTLSQNWEMKAEKVLPMDLYQQMKSQQEACDELLTKKEELITNMRREVEEKDFEYENSLEMYQKDTMLMGDRIDDLIGELRNAFVDELNLIEDYTCKNRGLILQDNQNEWLDLLQDFETMEQSKLEERKMDAMAKFQHLNEIFTRTKQEARELQHKIENDIRVLIQEREQIKYACHLNLEKLTYNLHILQCRSKENVELKNKKKRMLLKLHDQFDDKAKALRKKMELGAKYVEKLTKELRRLEEQTASFEGKTLHLALVNHKKFMDLWEVNEDLVRNRVTNLLESDKFIYETQLGIEYVLPDIPAAFDSRPAEVAKSLQRKLSSLNVDKVKYPSYQEVNDYWEGIMNLLNSHDKEVWDMVQQCFDEYSTVLKKRNEAVIDIQKYYQQNFELSHLLQKYFENNHNYRPMPQFNLDPRSRNFCCEN